MHRKRIAIIPGDGIGIDVTREAVKVLRAADEVYALGLELEELDYGAERYLRDGTTLPAGEMGEVFMRSNRGATYRYVGAEARVSPDGWESLGDMGWMDEEGYLYLADRRTDLIIAGGANIYPAEVEGVLYRHEHIAEVAVLMATLPPHVEMLEAIVLPRQQLYVGRG